MEIVECECEDKPIITFCRKCNSVSMINQDNDIRTELAISLKELLEFISKKERE